MENAIRKARTRLLLVFLVSISTDKIGNIIKKKKIISMNLSAATCNDQQLATKFKWWTTDYCIVTLHAMAGGTKLSINYFQLIGKIFSGRANGNTEELFSR
jgi:hypothetical protein